MDHSHQLSWEEAVLWLKHEPGQEALVEACFYDDPLHDAALRYWKSAEWTAVRALLPLNVGRALDVGAGRGISSFALAKDGWSTTALEPNASAVVGAGAIRHLMDEGGLAIDVVEQWGERLPFPDASFDLVHCRQVLHHARDLGQLCAEVGRVLRPGGTMLATREHVISTHDDLTRFLDAHPLHKLYGGEHAFRLDEYVAAIEQAGLHLSHVFNPNESPINTYPETLADIKRRYARRFHWPFPEAIPDSLVYWAGARSRVPGRLYTFVGRKPSA